MTNRTEGTTDEELFEAINREIEAEHAHFINKLKPVILPLIREYGNQRELEGRKRAIGDVKREGYGYDDGTGFVLKISYAELSQLQSQRSKGA